MHPDTCFFLGIREKKEIKEKTPDRVAQIVVRSPVMSQRP